jgi:hypothetical protein
MFTRILTALLGLLIFAALVAVVIGAAWVGKFIRSEEFRTLASKKASEALKIEGEFSSLQWEGSSVYSPSLRGEGRRGEVIEFLSAERLRARYNWRALFSGAWRLDDVSVGRLDLRMIPGQLPETSSVIEPLETTEARSTPLPSWIPNRFELDEIHVESAGIHFSAGQVKNTEFRIARDGNGWLIRGRGGELSWEELPLLTLGNYSMRLAGNAVFLTSAELSTKGGGKIEASGEISEKPGHLRMRVSWLNLPAELVIPDQLRPHLKGTMEGNADLNSTESGFVNADGFFLIRDGLLEGIHVLEKLATFSGSPQFRRLALQEVSGNFTRKESGVEIRDFVLESKGLVRVEGNYAIDGDERLSGTVQVGLTPQTLQWIPGSRERVFTENRNGYVWTPVRLGGTVQSPSEDLSARLVAAAVGDSIQSGTRVLEVAPDAVKEGAGAILDILSPLLPR